MVVDTETGGLDPSRHALLTVGLVALDPEQGPIGSVGLAIRDEGEVDPRALKVNRLDVAAVRADGLLPADAVDCIEQAIRAWVPEGRVMLAGHNVSFDVGFLRRLYRLAGRDYDAFFSHRLIDLHSWYWLCALAGRLPITSGSLDAIAQALGFEATSDRHTAVGDALLTARCLHRILAMLRSDAALKSA